jgi:ParB-like nuclease domain
MSSWSILEAQQAFDAASRARRRAALRCRLVVRRCGCRGLAVVDERTAPRGGPAAGVRAIPLEAISATVEPNRAAQFDGEFRPGAATRERWLRIWLAEHRGTVLPPISVLPTGDGYAVRDGHHRVSVAKARGAVTIDAVVAPA